MLHFNEDTRVKFPATIHFLRLGYQYQSLKGASIDFNTKIFIERFKSSIEKINGRNYSYEEISSLIDEIHSLIKYIEKYLNASLNTMNIIINAFY